MVKRRVGVGSFGCDEKRRVGEVRNGRCGLQWAMVTCARDFLRAFFGLRDDEGASILSSRQSTPIPLFNSRLTHSNLHDCPFSPNPIQNLQSPISQTRVVSPQTRSRAALIDTTASASALDAVRGWHSEPEAAVMRAMTALGFRWRGCLQTWCVFLKYVTSSVTGLLGRSRCGAALRRNWEKVEVRTVERWQCEDFQSY